jgi:homoserine dehydrogenase
MKVNVGIVGFGIIGSGVIALLQQHAKLLEQRSGVKIELLRVIDIDLDRPRTVSVDRSLLSTDYRDVINDPRIDIVIELVGGTGVARDVVTEALAADKHVVTANKALLCARAPELFRLAAERRRELRFEASVGGGIPIIKAITESLASDHIATIYGIVNGTTNFILTRMIEESWPFAAALKRAQELGFAEADPTLDINGGDAAHKLNILASVAFDTVPEPGAIYREGIEHVQLADILYAKELGYVVKLLAIAKRADGAVSLRVHPTLIPSRCSLASVKNEFNAVMIESEFLGRSMFVGRGAGARPTATAVVADIVDIARDMVQNKEFNASRYLTFNQYRTLGAGDIMSRFYLRLATEERAGILAQITTILSDQNISISAITQEEGAVDRPIPIVILTRLAREANIRRAVAAIDAMDFTREPTVVLHVEDIDL